MKGALITLLLFCFTLMLQAQVSKTNECKFCDLPSILTAVRKSIKVYPNLNNGQLTLELTNIENRAQIFKYNLLRARVNHTYASIEATLKINLAEIKKGIYFVKVIEGKEQFAKKLVVN
jgi:hypothetical protein